MDGLTIKYRDGDWHVLVPEGADSKWVACDSESDAILLALSSEIANDALEGVDGEEIAAKLEERALLSLKYGRAQWADYLRELAKLARHEPSRLDGHIWD